MTPAEMLTQLHKDGVENGKAFHNTLHGVFGWTVDFENGDAVLTVNYKAGPGPAGGEDSSKQWVLTPKTREDRKGGYWRR